MVVVFRIKSRTATFFSRHVCVSKVKGSKTYCLVPDETYVIP